jgi:hypothetical protein
MAACWAVEPAPLRVPLREAAPPETSDEPDEPAVSELLLRHRR